MKIVVLDGYTLNPGDLSWDRLNELGDVTLHDRTPSDKILEQSAGANVLFTNKTPLSGETIAALPNLKYIGVLATGYNVVDTGAARERGIPVTNIPAYGTNSVAQMVFAHILNFTQRVAQHDESVKSGNWSSSIDFCYWDFPLFELQGMKLGIIGLGAIGRATAELGRAFGMEIMACNSRKMASVPDGVKEVELDQLFEESDFVSLHCPLTADNEHLINASRLKQMKSSAFLVNTSRGPLVDESALAEALIGGEIAGAGLDVLGTEPPAQDNPLIKLENCFITPHIAWATQSARSRLMQIAVDNLDAWVKGTPQNVINP